MFTWSWLADVCAAEGIVFVLGHALAMKAIHGGKAKNDTSDAHKIAVLLRGGMLPHAYVYPVAMRATRDLPHRRLHLTRFDRVQECVSHARLITCTKESGGKKLGTGGAKRGSVHLKGAFSEAAVTFLRHTTAGKKLLARREQKHGKGKALSMLAHKIGRAVYDLLSRGTVFSMEKFLAA
jgi:transposase